MGRWQKELEEHYTYSTIKFLVLQASQFVANVRTSNINLLEKTEV